MPNIKRDRFKRLKCPQCLGTRLVKCSAPVDPGATHSNYRCNDCECEFTYIFADSSYRIYKAPTQEGLDKVGKLINRSFVDGDDFFYTGKDE